MVETEAGGKKVEAVLPTFEPCHSHSGIHSPSCLLPQHLPVANSQCSCAPSSQCSPLKAHLGSGGGLPSSIADSMDGYLPVLPSSQSAKLPSEIAHFPTPLLLTANYCLYVRIVNELVKLK